MLITNNKSNVRYLFYKVAGQPKSVKLGPFEMVEIPDLISITQITYNALDYKMKGINERFGTNFELNFTTSMSSQVDYHLLDSWYSSLSVKPSASLWTDLQALANGMYEDGNWDKLDLFAMVGAMETNEQRLRPLKTQSGSDLINAGVTFSSSGATSNGTSTYLNLQYNTVDDGGNYQFTAGTLAVVVTGTKHGEYGSNSYGTYMGVTNDFADYETTFPSYNTIGLFVNTGNTFFLQANINFSSNDSIPMVSKRGYKSFNRLDVTNVTYYVDSTSYARTEEFDTNFFENIKYDFLGCCDRYLDISQDEPYNFTQETIGTFIIGAGDIDNDKMDSRLRTFFTSRGISY
jgi:hypothetical protein